MGRSSTAKYIGFPLNARKNNDTAMHGKIENTRLCRNNGAPGTWPASFP
jgi:hypothetical protein